MTEEYISLQASSIQIQELGMYNCLAGTQKKTVTRQMQRSHTMNCFAFEKQIRRQTYKRNGILLDIKLYKLESKLKYQPVMDLNMFSYD